MIRHTSFKHGWFYHYRLHSQKIDNLCIENYNSLRLFLDEMFRDCPDVHFTTGPRSSALRFNLDIPEDDIKVIKGHEISAMAQIGLDVGRYKTAHSNVQVTMLEMDDNTLAVEVPIWIMPEELEAMSGCKFGDFFEDVGPLSGHIDALCVENGDIWIWDFKPKAHKEKYATTQIYFYALMLSKRTGIPLEHFRCGYFDEHLAYVFKPELDYLKIKK
ncbi:hypothetical protein HN419_01705 [Candidatus Woesearchaeota archaeon]|jgi:hypothetical protein|nr:hypothetical protein [Candidatus Woesearchaeota archaeon]MBT3537288.1 hypothetical protein [Candidatus Woesearchaeota archaeon]MBT4716746.1 hypothetical protein [Candidatus Woesearchaeota archaeon]MBT7106402.1 hypothetical protein [Candidatus Woesearchaeota archaeon]MBT7931223.1 hypothetical protein [Candidatus Woesearchaeota archaeon]